MKNIFLKIGFLAALISGGLFAAPREVVVTLPHAVTVGSVTLPGGIYTISELGMPSGDDFFVVRSADGKVATLQAQKIDADEQAKTEVVFSKDGDTWHFERMFLQNDNFGYQFVNVK